MLLQPPFLFLLAAATIPFALADVAISAPSGASAGSSVTVSWTDSGQAPRLADLNGLTLFLMLGGSKDPTDCLPLGPTVVSTHGKGTSIAFTFPEAATGPSGDNAYFFKMISTPATGAGQVTNYSPRFTITGMTGTWPGGASSVYEAGWKSVASSPANVPPTANTVGKAAVPGAAAGGDFGIPYAQQLGPTKYAPMLPPPHSAITATNTAPQYAPSAWTLASDFLPIPTVVTTNTAVATFTTPKQENTAAAAPMPSNDMQKFLARWKD